jgi:hypothetical protein
LGASHLQLVSGANCNSQGCWIDWNAESGGGKTNILNQKGGGVGGIGFGDVTNTNVRTINMFLNTNGNLGIGTTSPQTLLDINNSSNPKMFLTRSNITRVFYSVSSAGIDIGADVNTTSLPIRFMPNNTEVLRIQTNGNVGIGTNNPSQKLQVAGSAIINNNLSVGGTLTVNNSTGSLGQVVMSRGSSSPPIWT